MQLQTIASGIRNATLSGDPETQVDSLCYDSRAVGEHSLFCALPGELVDGIKFVPNAIVAGASAVLAERERPLGLDQDLPWIHVESARRGMAEAAAAFYDYPSLAMKVAGVTGTNGKTTTAFLLHHLIVSALRRCGMIGTVQYDTGVEIKEASRTTPESLDMQALLAEMRDVDCRGVVMEVSSHGLQQDRARGIEFDVALFTNLSRDHLDYHGDMESYYKAKRLLFEQMASQRTKKKVTAVINGDDTFGRRLVDEFKDRVPVLTYGMGVHNDFRASDIRFDFDGTAFSLAAKGRSFLVRLPLLGRFNIYNAMAAIAAATAVGLNLRESVRNLANAPQVPGRLESVGDRPAFKVFVDYAHTPDALENAIKTVRELKPKRLITVFGCGGNRDREKRAQMGEVAARLSDFTFITSDNPRKEDPQKIIGDIVRGFSAFGTDAFEVREDREEAIREAISKAQPRDIVLIAGKGHETTQEFADCKVPFDDRKVAVFALRDRARDLSHEKREREIEEREQERGRDPRSRDD